MPKKAKKRLPVLNADQLQELLQACNVRDKAIILFLADSGLRREEVAWLDWDDIDMQSGLVRVKQRKGSSAWGATRCSTLTVGENKVRKQVTAKAHNDAQKTL